MGIYIKGISKEEFLTMYHRNRDGVFIGFNPEAITEIEEPHGRLIDADRIEIPHFRLATDRIKVFDAVDNAPTVIEAEGEQWTSE